MNNAPNIKRPLKDSAKILGGGTPSKSNYAFWQGDIPWVSPKDMKTAFISDSEDHISELALQSGAVTLVPANSVLIVVRSGILRHTLPIAINTVPVTINQDMKALIPFDDITSGFLAWWFRAKANHILQLVKGGTTVQSIAWDEAGRFEVDIPPLSEQRRVVARIDALAARIEEARGLRRAAGAEAEVLWLSSVGEILSSIREASSLKEGASVICGQHLTPEEQGEAGIPYITGPADFTGRVAVPTRYATVMKATSQPGDILLTVKGAGVGKVNLAPSSETVIGRQLFAIRPHSDKLDTLFLLFVLQYRLSSLRDAMTATTVPGIGRDDVETLEIPFPSLEEQRRIVAYLDGLHAKADALKRLQAEAAAELEALLPSVLDQAFRGAL